MNHGKLVRAKERTILLQQRPLYDGIDPLKDAEDRARSQLEDSDRDLAALEGAIDRLDEKTAELSQACMELQCERTSLKVESDERRDEQEEMK